MNNHHLVKLNIKNIFLLALIIIIFLFNFATIAALEDSSETSQQARYSYKVSKITENYQIKELNELYASIVGTKNIKTQTIIIDGNLTKVIELPINSTAIKLPDNTIAIKYNNENISILPQGSIITKIDQRSIIRISNQSTALLISEVFDFPIENLTKTASIVQSISSLDSYKVNIVFNELNNEIISDNIENYSVLWGDGNIQSFNKETKTVSHVYKKSGTYSLTVKVKDEFGITHQLDQNYTVEYEGHLLHTYFILEENKEPIAVTSTGLSAVGIGLIALTETGKYKFLALLPFFIPLYTRIQKEDVLDQFVRGQIFGYIKTNPGVHYNQIRRGMGVKNGTLSYHLSVLEKTELIKSRREGLKYRAFYPTGMKFPKNERFRLTELQIEILNLIKKRHGINQKEIAEELGKKPQTINYNIKILKQAELIDLVKKGRKTICFSVQDNETSEITGE